MGYCYNASKNNYFKIGLLYLKGHELRYQHEKGPFNIFILDTSSFLGNEGPIQLKETFTTIINGNIYVIGQSKCLLVKLYTYFLTGLKV